MSNEDDMQNVTRKELRDELAPIHAALADVRELSATKEDVARLLDSTRNELVLLESRMATRFVTKQDLANALARMATKEDLANAVARMATKEDLATLRTELRTELSQDTARAINSAFERFSYLFSALDDKYKDLPNRISRLEDEGLPTRMTHVEKRLFDPPATPKRAARRTTKKRRRAG